MAYATMAAEKEGMSEGDQSTSQEVEQTAEGENLSPEMLIKHPLQNRWSLWFYMNDKSKAWEENLLEITSFDTVEDFWALYNHIEVASKLRMGCDYALFKYGIKPMWEDERNKKGGRWLINLNRNQRSSDLDAYWLEIVKLAPIRKCKAAFRYFYRKKLKERLNMSPRQMIGFEAHADTQSKTGSSAKNRYQV
ncbi:eukaryotic translation initiation factor 4E-like [Limulus polyphemus]|uniref:eIF-4F 25 kDa subunit n=1 Tax=Limulus polyphemus TaxID=6850 RepID=A0ABM1BU73_LIMPO|nr:eukaryotic translation initiation factor 4E-like [Limulus polyphemus]